MRSLVIVLVLMAVSPLRGSTAAADGKWGIGAGLFADRGEAALMRRLSERTILGIEVRGFRREGPWPWGPESAGSSARARRCRPTGTSS